MTTYPTAPRLPSLLLARDHTRATLRRLVGERPHFRAGPGAYAESVTGPAWQVREHQALAGIAATRGRLGDQVVISHASAARVHGLWVPPWDGRTHVTGPSAPGRQSAYLQRHVAELGADEVLEIDGLRVTTISRTILDCALRLGPRWGLAVADSGFRILVLPSREDPGAHLSRQEAIRGHLLDWLGRDFRCCPGLPTAIPVVSLANGLCESSGESGLIWSAVANGAPEPERQYPVHAEGIGYFLDAAWEFPLSAWTADEPRRPRTTRGGLIVIGEEYDGELKYAQDGDPRREVLREKTRQDRLLQRNVFLQRRTHVDLRDPGRLGREILARLPRRIALAARPIPGLLALPPDTTRPRRRV